MDINRIAITRKSDTFDGYNLNPIGDTIKQQVSPLQNFFELDEPNYRVPKVHSCTDSKNFLNSSMVTQFHNAGVMNTDPSIRHEFTLVTMPTGQLALLVGEPDTLPDFVKPDSKTLSVTTRKSFTEKMYFHKKHLSDTIARRAKSIISSLSRESLEIDSKTDRMKFTDGRISISEHELEGNPALRVSVIPTEIFLISPGLLEIPLL